MLGGLKWGRCRKRHAPAPDASTVRCILLQCSIIICKHFSPETGLGVTKHRERDNWPTGARQRPLFFRLDFPYDHA
ncbi:hypothetical protein [Polaromonas sp. CG9_12]|nr:hypothetical protein [Polaromonas sp. CG9_12]